MSLPILLLGTLLVSQPSTSPTLSKLTGSRPLVPTAVGSSWVYAGWICEASGRPNELDTRVTKKTVKVVDSINTDNFSAALALSEVELQNLRDLKTEHRPDSYEVWMIFDNCRYYEYRLEDGDTSRNRLGIWRSLQNEVKHGRKPEEPDDMDAWQIRVPSYVGDGVPEDYSRPDTWYCWCTEKCRPIKAGSDVADYHLPHDEMEYTVVYRSCPADVFRKFTSGIGITGSSYTHHGTPFDSEEDLVEFHPAQPRRK